MRRYASGMTEPVHLPFEETALLWEMAGEPAFAGTEVIPGYPGTGHELLDLVELDIRGDLTAQARPIGPDVRGLEAGHFLG